MQVEVEVWGLDVSEARRLKVLEDENARLKKPLAGAMLDNTMLKDIASKNGNARRQTGGRGSPLRDAWGEPAPGVLDRPITEFIAGEALRETFADLFHSVLDGARAAVRIDYRCDAPT